MGPKQEINPLQMAAAGLLGPNLVRPEPSAVQEAPMVPRKERRRQLARRSSVTKMSPTLTFHVRVSYADILQMHSVTITSSGIAKSVTVSRVSL